MNLFFYKDINLHKNLNLHENLFVMHTFMKIFHTIQIILYIDQVVHLRSFLRSFNNYSLII